MVQYRPPYSKLIYITYDEESRNVAFWLQQRLKYHKLPVLTPGVDDDTVSAGFAKNSIAAASPIVAVIAGLPNKHPVSTDLEEAYSKNKEVIFFCLNGQFKPPGQIANSTILIAKSPYDVKDAFDDLRQNLLEREYPAPRYSDDPDGDYWLEQAREHTTNNRSTHLRDRAYLSVFNDLYNRTAKKAAVRDLGDLRALSGLIAAVLQVDPQVDVQTEAALALAKFDDLLAHHYLYEASQGYYADLVTLYASVAYRYSHNPDDVRKLVNDLVEVLRLRQREPDNFPQTDTTTNEFRIDFPSIDSRNQIFISYARKDAEGLALDLAHSLQNIGFSIWIDTKLEPGTPAWTETVERAIRQTEIVIVLVSPAVNNSIWVKREIRVAEDCKKEIIPITAIRTAKPLELSLTQGLRGDPILSENMDRVLQLLVETLRRKGIVPAAG